MPSIEQRYTPSLSAVAETSVEGIKTVANLAYGIPMLVAAATYESPRATLIGAAASGAITALGVNLKTPLALAIAFYTGYYEGPCRGAREEFFPFKWNHNVQEMKVRKIVHATVSISTSLAISTLIGHVLGVSPVYSVLGSLAGKYVYLYPHHFGKKTTKVN